MGEFEAVESCVSFEFLKGALWLLCRIDWKKVKAWSVDTMGVNLISLIRSITPAQMRSSLSQDCEN